MCACLRMRKPMRVHMGAGVSASVSTDVSTGAHRFQQQELGPLAIQLPGVGAGT